MAPRRAGRPVRGKRINMGGPIAEAVGGRITRTGQRSDKTVNKTEFDLSS